MLLTKRLLHVGQSCLAAADVLASDVDATDCQCADQLYGSTTTTKDTSVAGTSLAAKQVKMGKFNAKTQKCSC